MKIFTYEDYLKCLKVLEKNEKGEYVLKKSVKENAESQEKNSEESIKVYNKYDKTFKIILENKEETANFINKALEFEEKVKPSDLEKYNRNFITQNFKAQEADIIYKLRDKKIFILIEHQTKIDFSMPYRILNYQMEIMRNCIDYKKVKNKDYKQALVIAIVLYTGKQKWTAKTHIREIQEKSELFKNNKNVKPILGNYTNLGNYNIIDINNYTKEELLENGSFLSQIILLEKSKNQEELIENLEVMIPKVKKENIETLLQILRYMLINFFDDKSIEEITNKIKRREGDNMLAVVEMLKKEKQKQKRELQRNFKLGEARGEAIGEARGEVRGEARGREKEKISLAKKMLKENFAIEVIEKITGVKREKIL